MRSCAPPPRSPAVYDVTSQETFDAIPSWLQELDVFTGDVPPIKLLVGNKADLTSSKTVNHETAKQLADELGIPFVETSAKDATNVEQAFLTMAKQIKDRMGATSMQNNAGAGKSTLKVGQGQNVQSIGSNGCCS